MSNTRKSVSYVKGLLKIVRKSGHCPGQQYQLIFLPRVIGQLLCEDMKSTRISLLQSAHWFFHAGSKLVYYRLRCHWFVIAWQTVCHRIFAVSTVTMVADRVSFPRLLISWSHIKVSLLAQWLGFSCVAGFKIGSVNFLNEWERHYCNNCRLSYEAMEIVLTLKFHAKITANLSFKNIFSFTR